MRLINLRLMLLTFVCVCVFTSVHAQNAGFVYHVDPAVGNDANDGGENAPLATLSEAWDRIPMGETLTEPVTIRLAPATYSEAISPVYWESRYGTESARITLEAWGDQPPVITAYVNVYDVSHMTFDGLHIITGGDSFHCEQCRHVSVINSYIQGAEPETYNTQETVKVNQSTYFSLINNDISGAWNNAVDFVAVQHAEIRDNRIHNADDWCAYVKGGSSDILVTGNHFYDCSTGGFSAGQGTGFQYMVPPYLHYEAYNVAVVDNLIDNTIGAGIGVQGGYNILIAHNTMRNVGERSHVMEFLLGQRTCDGDSSDETRARCTEYAASGWGNDAFTNDTSDNYVRIPNRHVYAINNIIYNAAPYQSQWQHFWILPAYEGEFQTGLAPNPAHADDDLVIAGNILWNGDSSMPLGNEFDGSCADDNPTCSTAQLLRDNAINTFEPFTGEPPLAPVPIPAFTFEDAPASGIDDADYFFAGLAYAATFTQIGGSGE